MCLARYIRVLLGIVLGAMLVGAGLVPSAKATGSTGHKQLLELKRATVTIKWRWDGPDISQVSAWQSLGVSGVSGIDVSIPGSRALNVLTEAGAFSALTGSTTGVFSDSSNPAAAAELFRARNVRYGVFTGRRLLGVTRGVIVATDNTDVAMISLSSSNLTRKISAMPLSRLVTTQRLRFGQRFMAYTAPLGGPLLGSSASYIGRLESAPFGGPTGQTLPPVANIRPGATAAFNCVATDTNVFPPGVRGGGIVEGSPTAGSVLAPIIGVPTPAQITQLEQVNHAFINPRAFFECTAALPHNIGAILLKGRTTVHRYTTGARYHRAPVSIFGQLFQAGALLPPGNATIMTSSSG